MKVLILTDGSRGDVQPFVALAQKLIASGHHVTLCAPAKSASIAVSHGVQIVPLDDTASTMLADPKLREIAMGKGGGLRRVVKTMEYFRRVVVPLKIRLFNDMVATARNGADLVVHHPAVPGHAVAEWLGVPAVVACFQPTWVPTRCFPNPFFPVFLPRVLYRLSYARIRPDQIVMRRVARKWRHETLGLPQRRGYHDILRRPNGQPTTVLHAFSRHILPKPLDYPSCVHTVGFWFLSTPPAWEPPEGLVNFIATGELPIYIGFGSMVGADPLQTGRLISEAVQRAGVRAVVATGWGGITTDMFGANIFMINDAPHDWLFPRMRAIVHHGGAGTTAAALAAGRPQVICPFIEDQPFNAHRMYINEVAPPPLSPREIQVDQLTHAIREVTTNIAFTTRAEELAQRIRAEDGITRAVQILESEIST